jgi:hypothetical protein
MDTKTLHQTKTQHTNIMSTDQTYQDQIFKDLPPTSVLHLFDPSYDYETDQQPIQTTDPNDTVATLHIPQTQDSGQKFTQNKSGIVQIMIHGANLSFSSVICMMNKVCSVPQNHRPVS